MTQRLWHRMVKAGYRLVGSWYGYGYDHAHAHGGDHVRGDRVRGDRVRGDRVHGDRVHGDRVHGDRVRGYHAHGDHCKGGRGCEPHGYPAHDNADDHDLVLLVLADEYDHFAELLVDMDSQ
jgi:hypothetical protein